MSLYNKKTLELIHVAITQHSEKMVAGVAAVNTVGAPIAVFYSLNPFYGHSKVTLSIYYKAPCEEGKLQEYIRFKISVIKNRSAQASKNWYTETVEHISQSGKASLIFKRECKPRSINGISGKMWYFQIVDLLTGIDVRDGSFAEVFNTLSTKILRGLGEKISPDALFASSVAEEELYKSARYTEMLAGKVPSYQMLEDNFLFSNQTWVCLTEEIMFTARSAVHINPTDFTDVKDYTHLRNFKTVVYVGGTPYTKVKEKICQRALSAVTGCEVPWISKLESEN